ncbi:MAG: RNA 2',3'-cyclic phosphodiesterase [Patescibacteria group bacterium]
MQINGKKRLFISLNLSAGVKEQISCIIDKLRKENKGVKWVILKSLHLTLHFLGYLDEEQSRKVQISMQSLSGKFKKMDFIFNRINAFPNIKNPRIIFVAGEQINSRSVFSLQELLGKELVKLGIGVDHRSWKLHITIGRAKEQNVNLNIENNIIAPMQFSISTFELMESELTQRGAMYNEVANFKL